MVVGVEDLGDVMGLGDVAAGLFDPGGIFAVVAIEELAVADALATPGADVPGAADELLIIGTVEDEVLIFGTVLEDDLEVFAVVAGILLEGDDVGLGMLLDGFEEAGYVIGTHGIIVIDKGDVLTAGGFEQGLPFESDAAVAVVVEDEVLDGPWRGDLRGDVLHEVLAALDAFPAGRGEDGEEGRAFHGLRGLMPVSSSKMAAPCW